jgi:hypothetical protein
MDSAAGEDSEEDLAEASVEVSVSEGAADGGLPDSAVSGDIPILKPLLSQPFLL